MKLSTNQRTLYLLSAALLTLTLIIVGVWVWNAPDVKTETETEVLVTPTPHQPITVPEVIIENDAQVSAPVGETVRTVVYYQDNYGYLVPVTKTIAQEPGIAKATLNLMVQSAYNDMEAARLGLRTVLPEGTQIDLDVLSNSTARVDLSDQVLSVRDAEAESNMVSAVVQTLTEFPTIDKVEFLIGGKKRDKLPYGTDVSGTFERGAINFESSATDMPPQSDDESSDIARITHPADMRTVQLYFPGETSSLIVPVTRMVYGPGDLNTAVLELAKGPGALSPLDNALPLGCGLIGVNMANGIATINFTKEFINIAEDSDGGRAALRALMLTCGKFDGVKGVEIQVEGVPYDPGVSTMATPTFVNDATALTQEYVRTQTASIIEVD